MDNAFMVGEVNDLNNFMTQFLFIQGYVHHQEIHFEASCCKTVL